MKSPISFIDLLKQIADEADRHRNFRVDTRKVTAVPAAQGTIELSFSTSKASLLLAPTKFAARQIAEFCGIPAKYWDRLESAPELLCENVNHWFRNDHAQRFIRTIDDRLRAWLSTSFRVIDHVDLAKIIAPELMKPGWTIPFCSLSEQRLNIMAQSTTLQEELRPGQIVRSGVTISNSEVGAGALKVEPTVFVAGSDTALIIGKSLRKNHVGRSLTGDEAIEEILSDETRALDDLALAAKIQDVVHAAVSEARFHELLAKLREAAETPIEEEPQEAVEITTRRFGLDEDERSRLLRNLIVGADLSVFGLANAVAKVADGAVDGDRAVELQRFSGEVLQSARRAVRETVAAA
jgi:hypothetical protein